MSGEYRGRVICCQAERDPAPLAPPLGSAPLAPPLGSAHCGATRSGGLHEIVRLGVAHQACVPVVATEEVCLVRVVVHATRSLLNVPDGFAEYSRSVLDVEFATLWKNEAVEVEVNPVVRIDLADSQ